MGERKMTKEELDELDCMIERINGMGKHTVLTTIEAHKLLDYLRLLRFLILTD